MNFSKKKIVLIILFPIVLFFIGVKKIVAKKIFFENVFVSSPKSEFKKFLSHFKTAHLPPKISSFIYTDDAEKMDSLTISKFIPSQKKDYLNPADSIEYDCSIYFGNNIRLQKIIFRLFLFIVIMTIVFCQNF